MELFTMGKKLKHSKIKNTGILYELLTRQITVDVLNGKDSKAVDIVKEAFNENTCLGRELQLYKLLTEKNYKSENKANHLFEIVVKSRRRISNAKIKYEKYNLIKKINENISTDVYNNFVPNYRSYATLAQIFNPQTPIKRRVLMENKILKSLTEKAKEQSPLQNVDSLVVTKYVERFNEEYSDLLTEQRLLLNNYIVSIGDNRADFIVFLNEELKRIRDAVKDSLSLKEVNEDPEMLSNTHKLLEKIDVVNLSDISDGLILKVLKLQSLVKEYQTDDN